MNSPETDDIDPQMRQLFDAVAPQVADRGFTDEAMRPITRMIWIRRLAATVLVAVALPLAVTVLAALLLPAEASSAPRGVSWDASIVVGLCLLLLPLTAAVRA
jgi:hypothetical protein